MRTPFTEHAINAARASVAAYDDDTIKRMYVEGLLLSTFPDHQRTDTCRCRACFAVCFDIIRDEYRIRFSR